MYRLPQKSIHSWSIVSQSKTTTTSHKCQVSILNIKSQIITTQDNIFALIDTYTPSCMVQNFYKWALCFSDSYLGSNLYLEAIRGEVGESRRELWFPRSSHWESFCRERMIPSEAMRDCFLYQGGSEGFWNSDFPSMPFTYHERLYKTEDLIGDWLVLPLQSSPSLVLSRICPGTV